jgi:hypothetical protein
VESQSWAKRQANGLQEIKKGLADGRLTQAEASKLLSQHARVSSAMESAFEDGEITVEERGRIWGEISKAEWSLFIAQSNADHGKPVLDPSTLARQGAQIDQIAQGVVRGELSGKEAAKLLEGQAGLAQRASEVEADGEVDWVERLEVDFKQVGAQYGIARSMLNEERALHGLTKPPPPPQPR